jgi:hypothetical protein
VVVAGASVEDLVSVVVTVVVGSASRLTLMQPVRQIKAAPANKGIQHATECVCFIRIFLFLKFVLRRVHGRHKRPVIASSARSVERFDWLDAYGNIHAEITV